MISQKNQAEIKTTKMIDQKQNGRNAMSTLSSKPTLDNGVVVEDTDDYQDDKTPSHRSGMMDGGPIQDIPIRTSTVTIITVWILAALFYPIFSPTFLTFWVLVVIQIVFGERTHALSPKQHLAM